MVMKEKVWRNSNDGGLELLVMEKGRRMEGKRRREEREIGGDRRGLSS